MAEDGGGRRGTGERKKENDPKALEEAQGETGLGAPERAGVLTFPSVENGKC